MNINSEAHTFDFCCGVHELGCNDLKYDYVNGSLKSLVLQLYNTSLEAQGAAFVITDNRRNQNHHKLLTKIVNPIFLGRSDLSGNKLYMWVIKYSRLRTLNKQLNKNKRK